ncbi:MAG: hypothetical protein JRJ84_10000 [Deltaproteobacteria bacterium]|nr:hypothetical protein [Deltaproteobacteria bacterium]
MFRRGVPLANLVTAVLVALIVLAAGSVGWSAYFSTRNTVDGLWRDLAEGLAERTTSETMRYIDAAVPFTRVSTVLLTNGELGLDRPEELLDYLEASLDANPNITWASMGSEAGTYLAVYRWPVEGEIRIHRTHREQVSEGVTRYRDEERGADGVWRVVTEHEGERFYDPRIRPWYVAATEAPAGQGRWVDPYLMTSRRQAGVSYSMAARTVDGQVLGVFSAEFETLPMSDYLGTLKVGRTGRVYIVDSAIGTVVAHPSGDIGDLVDAENQFLTSAQHPDPMLSGAWEALQGLPEAERWEPFAFDEYLAMAEPFSEETGISWLVLTVVPSDDFFGEARAEARNSVIIALGLATIALLLGLLMSRVLTRSVGELQEEMRRLALFELTPRKFGDTPSAIRELNDMGDAADSMKQGLRAFGRYVPRQLVRHLLRSGKEAVLGAERREMTVLFSDIWGFTTIVESTPADEVLAILGEYLDGMNEAIHGADGTVCQYLGDGIMAFWGAPEVLEDHALRACRGGLAMRDHVDRLLEKAKKTGKPGLATRFGINTGEVMVGNIGASERFNYGILGDAVNTASRLEVLNKTYGTRMLLGERTAELVEAEMVIRLVDWVRMKGKRKRMVVYELIGEPDAVDEATRAAIDRYTESLRAYREGRFAEAAEGFREVDAALGGDGPSQVLLRRCEAYVAQPPPEDWDGVFVMTKK